MLYTSCSSINHAYKIDKCQSVLCPALGSLQEEADSRIVLHCVVAAANHANQIVIDYPDTDVLVLLLHHQSAISANKIFVLAGHTRINVSLLRYIPIHLLHGKVTTEQLNISLPICCITGCDTVSSFHRCGKAKAFKIIMEKAVVHQSLKNLGTNENVGKTEREACSHFVGALYGKMGCNSLNALRCEKAAKKVSPRKLPPTEDSFHQHVLRTAYQLMMWRQGDKSTFNIPDPLMFGYFRDESNLLCPVMMTQSVAAPELLNNLIC